MSCLIGLICVLFSQSICPIMLYHNGIFFVSSVTFYPLYMVSVTFITPNGHVHSSLYMIIHILFHLCLLSSSLHYQNK